ncbi:MAG: VCBS repeat-containing protein [Planctomycetota bacterium]|nr:VCBS repeat-containing protein [Planctomycetota bacterium]
MIWNLTEDITVATRIALQLRVFEVQNSGALREGIRTTTTSETISVGGWLNPADAVAVVNEPNYVETADFNGDGRDDLLLLGGNGDLQIFLQTPNGLVLHQSFDVGRDDPRAIATGDLNGDGRLDIATAPQGGNAARVYLQDAQGLLDTVNFLSFSVGTPSPPFGPFVIWVAVGDINGDQRDDLVMSSSSHNDFIILIQDDQGQLVTAPNSPFPGSSQQDVFSLGDVNGDGRSDLIAIDSSDRELNVYLQDAQGGLAAASYSPLPMESARELVVGDLNGDGFNDVAAVNNGANQVTVFLQEPLTHVLFEAAYSPLSSDDRPLSLALGDLDGDGLNDLAVVSDALNTLQVYFQRDGMLRREVSQLTTDDRPFGVTMGDFDGNGQQDIAVSAFNADTMRKYHQNGRANLQRVAVGPSDAGVRAIQVGIDDLNSDGLNDVIITDFFGSQLLIYEQNRLGKLAETPQRLLLAGRAGVHVVGDFNNDSRPDIAVTDVDANTLTVYFQDAQGDLNPGPTRPIGNFSTSMCKGDFNGDGRMDLAVGSFGSNEVSLFLQRVQGGFGTAVLLPSVSSPVPVSADLNGDGLDDLIVGNNSANGIQFYLQDSAGQLILNQAQLLTDDRARVIIPKDLNGDGRIDLAVLGTTTDRVRRLIQDAQGGFSDGGSSNVLLGSIFGMALGDLNGDGFTDYAIADAFGAQTLVLAGEDEAGLQPLSPAIDAGIEVLAIAIGDLNGDGRDDLIAANADSNNPKLVTVYLRD